MSLTLDGHTFFTPLPREGLFDPGSVFAPTELTRRVLSLFWRDCCCPPNFNRAPAPVLELVGANTEEPPLVLRIWWLSKEGITTEANAPTAPRLEPYPPPIAREGPFWPRYDFRISASPFDVEMMFHRSALASQGLRTRLFVQPDGRVRVLTRSEWWMGRGLR